jgi:hypothetical protein
MKSLKTQEKINKLRSELEYHIDFDSLKFEIGEVAVDSDEEGIITTTAFSVVLSDVVEVLYTLCFDSEVDCNDAGIISDELLGYEEQLICTWLEKFDFDALGRYLVLAYDDEISGAISDAIDDAKSQALYHKDPYAYYGVSRSDFYPKRR